MASDAKAIEHLKQAVAAGQNWYLALLEAVNMWASKEEDYHGRHYRYLIADEAFDWLVLAERLCEEINGLIPEKERIDLLFFGRAPVELTRDEFRKLMGDAKYQAYLNYLYGILVEQFLILAVTEEVRQQRRVLGLNEDRGVTDEAYLHIYGATQEELLKSFRKEKGYPQRRSIGLTELDEFTYWLFKYRLKRCDKSRVASDTKKAITKLYHYLTLKVQRSRVCQPS